MLHPLQRQLGTLRKNARRLLAVFGLGRVAATALAGMIILGLVDYLIRYQDLGLRVLSSLTLAGLLVWNCYRYVYRILIHRLSDAELARRVERCHPELGDSLLSAVEFLNQMADDPTAGSAALRRAVIAETTARSAALDFSAVLDRRPGLHSALATLLMSLLAAVLIVLEPSACRIAVARLVNPFGAAAWPRATHLKLVRPVDRVARGQPFEIEVIDARGAKLPAEVRIHYRAAEAKRAGLEETQRMRFLAGAMTARRENVTQPFFFRVEGGDDQSMPWTSVEVVEPPLVQSLHVRLEPPAYTLWPPYDGDCRIRSMRGTRIRFQGESNRPLQSAVLSFQDGRRLAAVLDGERRFHVPREDEPLRVDRSQSYWLTLTDRDSAIRQDSDRWEIRAVPDNPPSVTIEEPAADVYVTPQAALPLRILAKDDLALQEVALCFSRSDRAAPSESRLTIYRGPSRGKMPVSSSSAPPSATAAGESRVIDYAWDLAPLDLRPGTEVAFYATASDYRPGVGRSDLRRLRVIAVDELQNRIAGRESLILAELAQVLKLQQDNRAQVAIPAARLAALGALEQSDVDHLQGAALNQRQIGRALSGRGEGVVRHIGSLLDDLDRNKVDSPEVRRRMQALLAHIARLEKEHLPPIGENLTTAVKAAQVVLEDRAAAADRKPSPDPRVAAALAGAVRHQDQVIASLSQMLGQLSQWDNYRRFYRDVAEMVRQQEDLGRRTLATARTTLAQDPKDLHPEQIADLGFAARGELELALRLEQLQESLQQASGQMADSDPSTAGIVADAAAEIDRRGTSAAMRAAVDHLRRNRMGQAIQGQKQILQDLDEVLEILVDRRPNEPARLQTEEGRGGQGGEKPDAAGKQLTMAELKLFQSLQQEINRRTRRLDAAYGSSGAVDVAARREFGDLGRDQGSLADRVGRFSQSSTESPPGGDASFDGKTDGVQRPPAESRDRPPSPPPQPADPLDRSLFEPNPQGVSNLPRAGQPQPGRLDAGDLSRQPMRQLGPAGAEEDENPLVAVARAMREVQRRIARSDAGQPTQAVQQQIVAELDRLIRQARTVEARSQTQPQTAAGRPGPAAQPPQPQSGAAQSGLPRGGSAGKRSTAGQPPQTAGAAKIRGMLENVWGELPGKQREQMLQTPVEEFLPEYESMLEDYFQRLAAPQEKRP